MDGKKYFCECCKDFGIDASKLFKLGKQNTESKGRLIFRPYYSSETQTQIFAVNYYSSRGFYIAWRTKIGKVTRRETFSVKKEAIFHVPSNSIIPIPKDVQYSGWDQELVYAFQPDSVKLFLQKYVLPTIEKE